uniref:Uncharacterized protein n=1 Tax=Trichogramma kaykai TaxID=54128 RepID=A0ABD2WIY0_9HYME
MYRIRATSPKNYLDTNARKSHRAQLNYIHVIFTACKFRSLCNPLISYLELKDLTFQLNPTQEDQTFSLKLRTRAQVSSMNICAAHTAHVASIH